MFWRGILFGCLIYLISASFTRISYKVMKDPKSLFWIVNINANERTEEIPMLLLPYSKDSWFSSNDNSDKNIEALVCDSSTACNILATAPDGDKTDYLNYTIQAQSSANLQAYPNAYTQFFNLTQADQSSTDKFPMKVPRKVVGGLGLGIDGLNEEKSSFFQGFKDLDNYVAGIYLSQDNFDITSELLIGDYNQAFIQDIGRNFTINVKDNARWSLSFSSLSDNTGHTYDVPESQSSVILDPNLNYIGIPDSLYASFLQNFTENNKLTCSTDPLFPVCDCDNLDVFPLLFLKFDQVNFILPPELYVQRGQACKLLIGSTQQVKVTQSFENFWVFGSPVLTYYYTMFNFNYPNSQLIFTKAKIFERNSRWYIIIGASSLVVVLAGVIAGLSLLKGKKQYQAETVVDDSKDKEVKSQSQSRSQSIDKKNA